MAMLPTIRCSSLPRIMSCTASIDKPDIDIDTSGKIADMGTAAHEFYARMVTENLDEPRDLFELATKYNVDERELYMLAWSGLREWKKIRDRIDVWDVEGEMVHNVTDVENSPLFKLTGHRDLGGRVKSDPTTGVIIDWKAGYKENSYLPQTKGYALLDLLVYGNPNHPRFDNYEESDFVIPQKYLLMVVWTRLGITETFEIPTTEILEFRGELFEIFRNEAKQYSPSDENCMYCPLKLNCEARRALLQAAGQDVLLATGGDGPCEMTPTALASLYPQSRMLKKSLEAYESAVKNAVEHSGGKLAFDGGELSFNEYPKYNIRWNENVLKDFLTPDQITTLFESLTVSKTTLDSMVSANAPNRKKKETKEKCIEALKKAGCAEKSVRKKLSYRKV